MASYRTSFVEKFSLKGPVVLAPLSGGPGTPELVAAVCNHGGLGSVGAAYMDAAAIMTFAKKTRDLTSKPFLVNIFTPAKEIEVLPAQLERAMAATADYRQELKLPPQDLKPPFAENFDQQFEAILALKPAAFSTVFGVLDRQYVKTCKARGIYMLGAATTLDEALVLVESGVDAIVLQGVEGGGHRGIFDIGAEDPQVSTLDLVTQCVAKIKIPLIAAGGLMTAKDIALVMKAGAQAAQLGTAFLLCDEAGTSKPYREALLRKEKKITKLTRVYSGRIARGMENRFMLEMEKNPESILPFPAQNKFTRDLRNASVVQGSSEFLSLWAGTGVDEIRTGSAGALVDQIFTELRAI